MLVTLIKEERTSTITLPEKVSGQYWIQDLDDKGSSFNLISLEGQNGTWVLKSNKYAHIIGTNDEVVKNIEIGPLNFYNLKITGYEHKAFIFTEPITEDRQKYTKVMVSEELDITIGREGQDGIVFANRFVSAKHAQLTYFNGQWRVVDLNSRNGTFVNGKRIKDTYLNAGDVIYIMGFKIIIGSCFFAYNNPDHKIEIKTNKLYPFVSQTPEKVSDDDDEDEYELPAQEYFYSSPRFKRDIEEAQFKIDSPPPNAIGEEMPMMLMIGPSMTMGMASMATALFAINNGLSTGNMSAAMPAIVMSVSMLIGTMLWPILSKKFEKRRNKKKEEIRQRKYKEYLKEIEVAFANECVKQEEILHENHVPISECIKRIEGVERNLWERGVSQNDFLKLRVGFGNTRLQAEVSYGERKFSILEDNLEEELFTLCEVPKELKDVPITLSLFDNYVSGVIGDRTLTKEFAKGLIFQIASLYSYDEVKMIFIYDEEETDFNFVKWLPHVWNNNNSFRFIATNNIEIKEISAYLEKEIEQRIGGKTEEISPYYVIFSMSKKLSVRAEMLKQIYGQKTNLCMSVVTFYDELKNLPKECFTVVEIEDGFGKIFDKNDITGQSISFVPDIFVQSDTEKLSIQLANVPLNILASSYKLPNMITFLEMFGVGKVEHLNALTRWRENDPTKSLEAEIGIDTLGESFKLDLHEKFHGPHGLVAGMTGSGKSEFIIAYILSLAVNYHPNEVAFILIDYKGGGMAKAFENLPHTAGIITNLDGAAVKRSLISIQSELKRRQAVFNEAGKKAGVSNIDIYKYQKLFREGTVSEPLQHLFIISDEFAELKTQQPEFMAQLISAARIGRSLGVHLILATQKPAGVVDDQIWSNSKFRICLKVQERADSMDMLKRPDAADLVETGRFYLQVGYNELFELGQSAWAGAPYYPADKVIVEKDNSVVVIDKNGRPFRQVKIDNHSGTRDKNPKKQLDVITDYLNNIAEEEKIKIRPLWLEPIEPLIYLNEVTEKYHYKEEGGINLNPVIGEYDDPEFQRQCILCLPITKDGNVVICGVAGSGKTTFLTTMFYSIIKNHTPDEVNIYILDFASETLKAFSKAPHVGDVILSYEVEKINNLFKMIEEEIEARKQKFADYGGDYKSYIHATGESLPQIIIAINNYAAFTETYEGKEDTMAYLTREGLKYGVYFILAATAINAIRFRLLQNFKQHIVLQLNDETEYSSIVGKTEGLIPSRVKGRGLVRRESLYEFQIANISKEDNFALAKETCKDLLAGWAGNPAKKVPILPECVDLTFIDDYVKSPGVPIIPIGVGQNSLEVRYFTLSSRFMHVILSYSDEHEGFVYQISKLMGVNCELDVILFDPAQSYKNLDNEGYQYCASAKDCEAKIEELTALAEERSAKLKEAMEAGTTLEAFKPIIVVLNSYNDLKQSISSESNTRMVNIFEQGDAKCGIHIIMAECVSNISGFTYDAWYKKQIAANEGIWVGNGFADQYQLKANKTTAEHREEISNEFGYIVEKGKPTRLKLLCANEEKNNG